MALTYVKASGIDVTGNYTVNNMTATSNVTAGYFIGNGSSLTGVTATSATTAATVTSNAQPNITSTGTLASLSVTGLTTATGGVKTANITDVSGTLTIQTKYNGVSGDAGITSNLVVGTSGTGNVTASYYIGDGSALTNINGVNVSEVANANYATYAGTVVTSAQPNITSVGTLADLTVTGNVIAGNISTTGSSGNISGANNISANTFTGVLTTGAQPNITSVGILDNATVSGNVIISGNLTVSGTTTYVNTTTLAVKDPIIEMGGGANGAALTSNDNKDRGSLLHYYTSQPVDAFMGWDNSNSEFGFGSDVTVSSEVVTWNTYGNLRAGHYLGNGSQLTDVAALTAQTVTQASQSNITSVGTLTSLTVSGNVTSGNATLGNLATSNYFSGNGHLITSLTGENVTGQVPNSLVAGTVYSNSQPNITSVGTLDGLTGSGVINFTTAGAVELGAVGNLKITGGTSGYFLQTDGTGNLTWAAGGGGGGTPGGSNTYVQFNDGDSFGGSSAFTFNKTTNTFSATNITGNLTTAIQSNITSVGTLASLSVTGLTTATGGVKTANILDTSSTVTLQTKYNGVSGDVGVTGNLVVGTSGAGNATASYIIGTSGITGSGVINFTGASNVSLGNVGNIHIPGGTAGYVLQTDGSGGLSWWDPTPTTTTYIANSLALSGGVYVTGDLYSIQVFGDYNDAGGVYTLTDGSGSAPAWTFTVDFVNVVSFNRVVMNINYTASSGHTVYVQLYNNSTSLWDNIGTYTGLGSYYAFALEVIDDTNYINGSDIVQLRLYHSNSGNTSHTTNIDYIAIEQSTQGPQGPRGPQGNTGPAGNVTISDNTTTNSTYYPVFANATSGNFTLASVSSTKLQFNPSSGQLTVQDLNTLSDATLKTNPEVIQDPMAVLSQIFGMGFNWADTGKKSYGLMAQMLEKVLPELVTIGPDGKKSVNYIPIIAFLIEAVKRQQSDIEDLKKR